MAVVRRMLTGLLVLAAAQVATGGVAAADLTGPTQPVLEVVEPVVEVVEPVTGLTDLTSVTEPVEPVAEVAEPVTDLAGTGPATSSGSTPKLDPGQLPSLPGAPTVPLPLPGSGGQQPPSGSGGPGSNAGSGSGRAGSLGNDVLPTALEDQLCAVLTTVLGHLPAQVTGLPATVIAQLPKQITDVVPADVLRTVTLQCPKAATVPAAAAPAETRSLAATTSAPVAQRPAKAAAAPRPARAGLAALPHTGALAGLPIAALTLFVLGVVLRRRAGDPAGRRAQDG